MLVRQLLFSRSGQAVGFHSLFVFRDRPLRADPALPLQPMQRRVKRAGIDLEYLAGVGPNCLTDSVSVLWPPLKRLENEQVERPLQQLDPVLIAFLLRHVDILHPKGCRVSTSSDRRSLGDFTQISNGR